MAKRFGTQLDLAKIPVLGLVPESSSSPPSNPVGGQFWYDSSIARLKFWENGAWALATSPSGVELLSNKGAVNGYPGLDGSSKIPIAQIPTGATGGTVPLGNDARFTDARTPIGGAGGDLTGTYPNPSILNGAVTDAKVAAANKDGVAATPSMRTLGFGALQALAGTTRTDQLALPLSPLSLNSQRIASLAEPVSPNDAATKGYVDGVASGLDIKRSVRVASVLGQDIPGASYYQIGGPAGRGQFTGAPKVLDGITLKVGDRILVKDQQFDLAGNGIFSVTTLGSGANGVWDRAFDFDSDAEVTSGAFTFVEEGSVADSGWVLLTDGQITVGGVTGSNLIWGQFSGSGSIVDGAGLLKTGNVFNIVGTTDRVLVNPDSIDISPNYRGQNTIDSVGTVASGSWAATPIPVAYGGTGATGAVGARVALSAAGKYAQTLGGVTAGTEVVITHNLQTNDVYVSVRNLASGFEETLSWRVINNIQVGITADVAYGANALRVTVIG